MAHHDGNQHAKPFFLAVDNFSSKAGHILHLKILVSSSYQGRWADFSHFHVRIVLKKHFLELYNATAVKNTTSSER